MQKFAQRAIVISGLASAFAAPVIAAPVDLTTLTTAVDFSTASAAVLVVAAALITVYIAIKAAKFVMNMVKSG